MKALFVAAAAALVALTAAPALAQPGPQAAPHGAPQATPQPVAAAAAIPNTFDGPQPARPAPAAAAAPAAEAADDTPPDAARSEQALRDIVAGIQGDSLDYAMFSDDLADKIRTQSSAITPLIKGFGALTEVEYVGQEQGADMFAVNFENARTQWIIGFNPDDQIAVLLFRPAPAQ